MEFVKILKSISEKAKKNSDLNEEAKEFMSVMEKAWAKSAIEAAKDGKFECDVIRFSIDAAFKDIPIKELLFDHGVYDKFAEGIAPAKTTFSEYFVNRTNDEIAIIKKNEGNIELNNIIAMDHVCHVGFVSVSWMDV